MKKKTIKDFKKENLPKTPFENIHGRARFNAGFFLGKKIADIGCGRMKFGNQIPEVEFDVTTFDVRPEVEPDHVCNILEGLPVEDETFDLVHTSHFMEHFVEDGWNHYDGWDDMNKCINEMARILKKGGDMIHCIPTPHSGMAVSPDHKSVYNHRMWEGVFSRCPTLEIVGVRGCGTWINIEGMDDIFEHLADKYPFFGSEYIFWLRKK